MTTRQTCSLMASAALAVATSTTLGQTKTYTVDADFDEGTLINVNHDAPNNDQLQMNFQVGAFPFINVAASARGTVVRINTLTGAIIGEYRTAPSGFGTNPSRTTVDQFGNVWAGNRAENGGGRGSVVKIGLIVGGTRVDADGTPNPIGQYLAPPFDYSTCVDRDGDGLIKTSRGLGNILAWNNVSDGAGGATAVVEDADDECIQIFQRVAGDFVRHVSVDANNNVWVAGNFGSDNAFDLLDGDDGAILASFDHGFGGYGGLVDGNGVLWSANRGPGGLKLLRYDTMNTITTADDTFQSISAPNSYGLGLDSNGNIWHSQWTSNTIIKYNASGTPLGTFGTGGASGDRGVAVTTSDDNIWVANSSGSDVSRLDSSGAIVKIISLGGDGLTPTGMAVDSAGKVWASCRDSNTVKRIDPNGGGDGLGAVDLTVNLGAGAGPYNYSDMTGTVLFEAIQQGTWTVVYDTSSAGTSECTIDWNSSEPSGTSIAVDIRASDSQAGLPGETFQTVSNGGTIAGIAGQFYEIRATFARDDRDLSPILFDLTITCNQPPECPTGVSIDLWPPNHKFVTIDAEALAGVTDPDGDPVTFQITGITQDELINSNGDGNTSCDGVIVDATTAKLRVERRGGGNGRVYQIHYTATDPLGESCSGVVTVTVPHDQDGMPAVDDGQTIDSLTCMPAADVNGDGVVSFSDITMILRDWGMSGPDETLNWPDADANFDGSVQFSDITAVLGQWGEISPN